MGFLEVTYRVQYIQVLQNFENSQGPAFNVSKSLFASMTSSPRCKSYFCRHSMEYKRNPSERPYRVRKLCHIVPFVRYLGQTLHLFKNSMTVAILAITQQKGILNKFRHGLSVNKLMIHINHIGTCHYQPKRCLQFTVYNFIIATP